MSSTPIIPGRRAFSYDPNNSLRKIRASPNTVQLGGLEEDCWGSVVGLGPVPVVSSFDVPLGHLSFDEARVGSSSAWWVESTGEHDDDVVPQAVMVVRGENRAPVRLSGARSEGPQRS
jgi:hypothetical protein